MYSPTSAYLQLLRQRIAIAHTPFSDRGSRLLVYRDRADPHALYIKLAERLTALIPGLSAYRTRPPFITKLCLADAGGGVLPFELTTYPHALVFKTALGQFVLVFQDRRTLSVGLPRGAACGIRFSVTLDLVRPDGRGGEFKSVRNCAYSTNGEILLNRVTSVGSGYDVVLIVDAPALDAEAPTDTAITLHIQAGLDLDRAVLPFRAVLRAAEERWDSWFASAPAVTGDLRSQYYYAWWVLGNNLLAPQGHFRREGMVPSKAHYIGAWQWDNCFHALAFRHTNPALARGQIELMLDHQQPDGMIPDAIYDEGTITRLEMPVAAAVTKPPIIAWVAMHIYDLTGDAQLLHDIYDALVRWNSWWFGMNDDDSDGIVQYSHPFSSGLDDSPLWDAGMPVEAVDLNTYLCIQMQSLGRMAQVLGRASDALMWRRKSAALAERMIQHFYDKKAGLFWSQQNHRPLRVQTPFSLYPLWTGELPPKMADRLVAHLRNPRTFWTPYPLPTVAISEPQHDPYQMWRGPVWININYIFVEALMRAGYPADARALAERTLALVLGQNDIYEYYHPLTGVAPPKAAPTFGWSAACFIDLAIRLSQGQL